MDVSEGSGLFELGVGLVVVGVVFIVLAVIILGSRRVKRGKTQVAGAVLVGPVPIVFGSDKKSLKSVLQLSVALTSLLIVLTLIYYFLLR
jgi:uncharacterized protein (TIGR00304 family)